MNEKSDLGEYKGYPVIGTSIIVNKLGDGLSKAVAVSPVVVHPNEPAFLGVRVRKTKERYDFVKDDDGEIIGVVLVQIFDSTGATFVEEKSVGKVIQKTVDAIIADEADRKRGQLSLVMPDDDETPRPGSRAKADRAKFADLADKVDEAMGGTA